MAETVQDAINRLVRKRMEEEMAERERRLNTLLRLQAERVAEEITATGHAEGWLPAHWALAFEPSLLAQLLTVRYGDPDKPEGYWQLTCGTGCWAPGAGNEWPTEEAAIEASKGARTSCRGAHAVEFVPGRRISDAQG